MTSPASLPLLHHHPDAASQTSLSHQDTARPALPAPPGVGEAFEEDTSLAAVRLLFSSENQTWRFVLVVTVLAHAAFIYGQTQIMWYLYFAIHVDASVEANSLPAKWAFEALQVPNPVAVDLMLNHTIEDFTYWTAIRGLWLGNTNPGPHTTDPGFWGKVSSIVLVFFSGLWPHIKLISLQYHYHRQCVPGEEESRTTSLYWLDTFGKWSLADVFVICTLLAVLNVDFPVDTEKLLVALTKQLEDIAKALENDATATQAAREVCRALFYDTNPCPAFPKDNDCYARDVPCAQCACLLERAFPTADILMFAVDSLLRGITVDGQGLAVLRVAGRSGIYVFCCGTMLSLGLSGFIDVLDHRARAKRRIRARTVVDGIFYQSLSDARANAFERRQSLMRRGEMVVREISRTPSLSNLAVPPPPPPPPQEQESRAPTPAQDSMLAAHWLPMLSILGLVLCIAAVFVPTLRRSVPGSITDLIVEDLDLDLGRHYSIFSLARLAGAAGGPDNFLMCVFGLFVVVGPIVRSLTTVALVLAPLNSKQQERMAFLVNSIGVFSALDVLLVAFFLVGLEMPRITAGIVSPSETVCRILYQLGENEYCVSIEFLYVWPWFGLVILAYVVVVACAVRVVRVAFFTFNPFGDEYPGSPPIVAMLAEGYFCGYSRFLSKQHQQQVQGAQA